MKKAFGCYPEGAPESNDAVAACGEKYPTRPCPQKPGTVLRIFIPAGAVINLLNLIEISSPSGICIIIRIPLLGGLCGDSAWDSIMNSIRAAGGKIEFTNE